MRSLPIFARHNLNGSAFLTRDKMSRPHFLQLLIVVLVDCNLNRRQIVDSSTPETFYRKKP